MAKTIFCQKLQKEGQALSMAPYPGPLGQKILDNISQEAWEQWQAHQTMLINENRLSMLSPDARQFLKTEMEKFLFGDGSDKPSGYRPPEEK